MQPAADPLVVGRGRGERLNVIIGQSLNARAFCTIQLVYRDRRQDVAQEMEGN